MCVIKVTIFHFKRFRLLRGERRRKRENEIGYKFLLTHHSTQLSSRLPAIPAIQSFCAGNCFSLSSKTKSIFSPISILCESTFIGTECRSRDTCYLSLRKTFKKKVFLCRNLILEDKNLCLSRFLTSKLSAFRLPPLAV